MPDQKSSKSSQQNSNDPFGARQALEQVRQERYNALRDIRKRYLGLHNRLPSSEEEGIYLKRMFGNDDRLEEAPLEESHPEDYLPIGAMLKVGATAGVGTAALLSQMLRKGEVKGLAKVTKQGGWIGSSESPGKDIAKEQLADRLFKANIPSDRVFKETGYFELVPGERRWLDLSFVDDIASGGIARRVPGTQVGIVAEGSLSKHIPQETRQFIHGLSEREVKLSGKPSGWRGTTYPSTKTIIVKDELLDDDKISTISHELQHLIQVKHLSPSGTNFQRIMKSYDIDESTARKVYAHAYGEVEARLTQHYHTAAKRLLAAGKSPEEVKSILGKVTPQQMLKSREPDLNLNKVWKKVGPDNIEDFNQESMK